MTPTTTRREFHRDLLGSITAFGLIEMLAGADLFADTIKPVIHKWMNDLNDLGRDVKTRKLKDVEWQTKVEELYKRCDLAELLKLLDFDKVAERVKFPAKGAASVAANLSKVEGLPAQTAWGRQIFAVQKGRSIVPHGHDNMCTGFIILKGDFIGRHYDRIEDRPDSYLIKPTLDRKFVPGECSTVSDHKDNVHWFKGDSDTAFIFNIHITGYNPESKNPGGGRVYVDPEGEKTAAGLIVAKKISSSACHAKYG